MRTLNIVGALFLVACSAHEIGELDILSAQPTDAELRVTGNRSGAMRKDRRMLSLDHLSLDQLDPVLNYFADPIKYREAALRDPILNELVHAATHPNNLNLPEFRLTVTLDILRVTGRLFDPNSLLSRVTVVIYIADNTYVQAFLDGAVETWRLRFKTVPDKLDMRLMVPDDYVWTTEAFTSLVRLPKFAIPVLNVHHAKSPNGGISMYDYPHFPELFRRLATAREVDLPADFDLSSLDQWTETTQLETLTVHHGAAGRLGDFFHRTPGLKSVRLNQVSSDGGYVRYLGSGLLTELRVAADLGGVGQLPPKHIDGVFLHSPNLQTVWLTLMNVCADDVTHLGSDTLFELNLSENHHLTAVALGGVLARSGNLERVYLNSMSLTPEHVSHLGSSELQHLELVGNYLLGPQDLGAIFKRSPKLKELAISIKTIVGAGSVSNELYGTGDMRPDILVDPAVRGWSLPSLERLTLSASVCGNAYAVIQLFEVWPRLQSIYVDLPSGQRQEFHKGAAARARFNQLSAETSRVHPWPAR